MKHYYLAVTVKGDKNESIFTEEPAKEPNPGYYAYVVKCSESDNLKCVLERIGGLLHANIAPSKKAACEWVTEWNNAYRANGTYLFDNPAF